MFPHGVDQDSQHKESVSKLTKKKKKQCFDGVKRLGLIRGKLRKKVWINNGDIILISLREYQDEKGDVILKYTADEARTLYVLYLPPPRGLLPSLFSTLI